MVLPVTAACEVGLRSLVNLYRKRTCNLRAPVDPAESPLPRLASGFSRIFKESGHNERFTRLFTN